MGDAFLSVGIWALVCFVHRGGRGTPGETTIFCGYTFVKSGRVDGSGVWMEGGGGICGW